MVVLFHSSEASLREYRDQLPFDVVADPQRRVYRAFDVGTALSAVLHPKAWGAAMRGMREKRPAGPEDGESMFGLPADLLIGHDGQVLACRYGTHADDQWSVDELLDHAAASAADQAPVMVSR